MHLLFVANFAADTGYAWDTIEAVFRRVGEKLVAEGHRISMAYAGYPNGPPRSLKGAPFEFLEFDYERVQTREGRNAFVNLLAQHKVDALYLTDRQTWSPLYRRYRRAGVRRIILHDRTSGVRTSRGKLITALKRSLHHVPGLSADCIIGVSDFVRRRLIHVNGTPPERTHLVYNGIDLSRFEHPEPGALHALIGLSQDTPIVFCSGRAQEYKGIHVVLQAVSLLRSDANAPAFVFCGDGPYLDNLKDIARGLQLEHAYFLGRRSDVPRLLGSASVAVVPSLWAEAFGLTVVEAMAAGVPLIAARSGGIPELIDDGVTGLIVEPNEPHQLARAIQRLLGNPDEARSLARSARVAARENFSLERAACNLHAVVSRTLAGSGATNQNTSPTSDAHSPARVA